MASVADADLKDTLHSIHMWTQVVGKIRLALTPLMNHWWNSTLFVTPRGLSTSFTPSGDDAFQIDFDFTDHQLVIVTSRGGRSAIPLGPMSVADLHRRVFGMLAEAATRLRLRRSSTPTRCPRPISRTRRSDLSQPGGTARAAS